MQTVNRETLRQFETRLLQVERSASLDLSFPDFFEQVQRAIQAAGETTGCTVWLYTHGQPECVLTTDGTTRAPALPAGVRGETPEERVVTEVEQTDLRGSLWCCRCFEDISRAFSVCLEVRSESDPADNFLFANATLALAECLASWFRRSLIARIDDKLSSQVSVTEFCHRVYPHVSSDRFPAIVASELRVLFRVDRLTLLRRVGGTLEVAGISGVDQFSGELETPQALRNLGELLFFENAGGHSVWKPLKEVNPPGGPLRESSLRILMEGGTTQVRGFTIRPERSGSDVEAGSGTEADWNLIAEMFGSHANPSEVHWTICREQVEKLAAATAGARFLRPRASGRIRKLAVLAGVTAGLVLAGSVPVDFELDAEGTYAASSERKFFAPGSGLIEQLAVDHETDVAAGQQLLRIHSSELTLRIQEVLGQLETERVRLSSLQRSRLSTQATDSGREGIEQAIGGEQAVRQRIADLETRLQLLRTQDDRLTLRAENAGRVYRRNLELDLKSRPVQQGDFLFDLIERDSTWHLKLNIREDLVKYLPADETGKPAKAQIRFRFDSEPGQRLLATLTRIDDAVMRELGEAYCVGHGTLDAGSAESSARFRHPGVSVQARIQCGKRAAAFVMFREFYEFLREKWFQWSR